MIKFPSTCLVHKELKFKDLFKNFLASKQAKDESTLVDKFYLEYVLNTKTLKCQNLTKTKEIYIFIFKMKTQIIPLELLKEFDKYVQLSTLFIFTYENLEYEILAYKNGYVPSNYFHTNWSIIREENIPLGFDLDQIYKYIFSRILIYKPTKEESSLEYIKRYNNLVNLQKEIDKLEVLVRKEQQPKKKFEYNNKANELRKKFNALKGVN